MEERGGIREEELGVHFVWQQGWRPKEGSKGSFQSFPTCTSNMANWLL
jgi:hypothetical protein